jgi:hypothetical protein
LSLAWYGAERRRISTATPRRCSSERVGIGGVEYEG